MTFNCQRRKQHHAGLNTIGQADSPVTSEYTNLKKLLVVGKEKGSILQDRVKCVLHIRSKVKLDTFEILHCSASERVLFEKYHSVTSY